MIGTFIILGIIAGIAILFAMEPALRQQNSKLISILATIAAICAILLFIWASTPIENQAL